MTEARAKDLSTRLTGMRMHPNSALRREALERRTADARAAAAADIVRSASWCLERRLPRVAAGLLALATRLDTDNGDIDDIAVRTVPDAFPWRDSEHATRTWLAWIREMLPADAHFLAADDPAWRRCTGPWKRQTIGFRTPHLLLFSRSDDVTAVGPCLRYGESTIAGLQTLLGDDEPDRDESDEERLDVRIHRNRTEYLGEATPGGGAPTWSLGYYSPAENVSRFYVPDPGESHEPLGRGLFKVLAHELTHHYVDARWVPRRTKGTRRATAVPGFWIVEGLARFVEDQMVDADTRGLTFDDETVESVDAAAQLRRAGHTLDMAQLVDMTQEDFARLGDDEVAEVTLRRSLKTYRMTPRNVFYEQAGALCFYLLRARGGTSRQRTIDYLLAHYTGRSRSEGWKALGFSSAKALDDAFWQFLQQVH